MSTARTIQDRCREGTGQLALLFVAGCASPPYASSLDAFNGGFHGVSRDERQSFTPPPPAAPLNARPTPRWMYDPGYRWTSRPPINRYSTYQAMPWLWWGGNAAGIHGHGVGSGGGTWGGHAGSFAGRGSGSGSDGGGGRSGP